jgi:hypothetical protein
MPHGGTKLGGTEGDCPPVESKQSFLCILQVPALAPASITGCGHVCVYLLGVPSLPSFLEE